LLIQRKIYGLCRYTQLKEEEETRRAVKAARKIVDAEWRNAREAGERSKPCEVDKAGKTDADGAPK